jgi:hypothetical protein
MIGALIFEPWRHSDKTDSKLAVHSRGAAAMRKLGGLYVRLGLLKLQRLGNEGLRGRQ